MKRAFVLGLGVLAALAAAIPVVVSAQGFPPPPPTTFYGNVPSGIVSGQGVIAIVLDGNSSQACGAGATVTDNGKVVYVVDVVSDTQIAGCGKTGRTVQFYFVSSSGGRIATDAPVTWSGPGPVAHDVTQVGPPLTRRGSAPNVAKDGVS